MFQRSELDLSTLPDLSNASPNQAAAFIIGFLKVHMPNSSTKLSLQPEGYPVHGEIEVAIRLNQKAHPNPAEAALEALKTGCGNCQELAYAGALILRAAGYQGDIKIGQFGINHQFLFVDNLIVDPWSQMICDRSEWKNNVTAYGGSMKEGVMRGRILKATHEELEDDKPEEIENITMQFAKSLLSEHPGESKKLTSK